MRTMTELEGKRKALRQEYEARIAALERQLKHDQTEKAFMVRGNLHCYQEALLDGNSKQISIGCLVP